MPNAARTAGPNRTKTAIREPIVITSWFGDVVRLAAMSASPTRRATAREAERNLSECFIVSPSSAADASERALGSPGASVRLHLLHPVTIIEPDRRTDEIVPQATSADAADSAVVAQPAPCLTLKVRH
jgi:hypothetical protein